MAAATQFDLIVIGAGPGGYTAAIRAAQLGMSVACVERESALGGTCLRVGCIPSKALLDSSEHVYTARTHFAEHGVNTGPVEVDLKQMLKRKDKVVKTLTGGIRGLFKKHKIKPLHGTGELTAEGAVAVAGKDAGTYRGKHVIIASGSVPVELPGLPFDGKNIVDSTDALAFDAIPERLLVVGGGAIGLELGSVWARLGSEVIVVELMDRLVPGADEELAKQTRKVLEQQGLKFQLGAKVAGAEVNDEGRVDVKIDAAGKTSFETVDRVLVAVGRRAYAEGLGLDAAGVNTDDRGRIVVDEDFQTAAEGIYAIGDVIAGPMLAHKAEEDGIACVERLAGQSAHVDYDLVPGVVYTWPELAWVGQSEEALRDAGVAYRKGTFPFMANGRARAAGDSDGMVKVLTEKRTDRLLGVHILGPRASDLIAEAVLAMRYKASADDIALTIHAHPTFPEAVKEACLDALGRVLNR